jgi:hypothetical protein
MPSNEYAEDLAFDVHALSTYEEHRELQKSRCKSGEGDLRPCDDSVRCATAGLRIMKDTNWKG